MMRHALIGASLALAALPAQAQLLTHKDLSLALALEIAKTAYDQCTAQGYGVSVVVVDRAGDTLVALKGDRAGPHTLENARRKAYTARTFRIPTSRYAEKYAAADPVVRQQATLPNVIAIPGGLPIKAGDEVIGGAGLSGTPGVDEPCVQAGLDKIADRLK
ncbi:MAG TPA: heme-binding protein [Stellaceae bacterium]|nr:heme-binding protein [Stellaceae bacterium]